MKKIILISFVLLLLAYPSYSQQINGPISITATESNAYGSGFSKALIYIDYASNNTNLVKPFIVFEGYDPGYYTKPKEPEGRKGVLDFIQEINDPATGAAYAQLQPLLQGPAQQYDIIYVNWVNGTDYLENNEKVAKAVINWVNNTKIAVNGVKEPNVIIGRSMGSVIARMALKHMEQERAANAAKPLHNTRLFISNDGGQQGSNVPQGYQHLANHFRDLYISTGVIGFSIENVQPFASLVSSPLAKLSVNETPGSRELQINHVNLSDNIDNTLHNSFVASLNALGYPAGDLVTPFSMVAVSNGSECAKPQTIGSGGTILEYTGDISTTGLTSLVANASFGILGGVTGGAGFQVLSFPPLMAMGTIPGPDKFNLELKVSGKADNQANQVYKGKINYVKKVLGFIPVLVAATNRSKNANASTLAYDYFPGGNQDLAEEDLPLPKPGSSDWIQRNVTFNHQPYCHVPVPSALDIGKGMVTLTYADYFTPYRGAVPPTGTKASPFTNGFITAFNGGPDNEPHTQIERRNGDWIADKLKGNQTLAENCEIACGASISGDAAFCGATSNLYTIPNLPVGATVVWTTAPAGVANANTPGERQTTLTRISNGTVSLTATISNVCGTTATAVKQNITVGLPVVGGTFTNSFDGSINPLAYYPAINSACTGYTINTNMQITGANSVVWSKVSSSGVVNYTQNGNDINFYLYSTNQNVLFQLDVSNSCGTITNQFKWVASDCGGGGCLAFTMSPNPAQGTLNVIVPNIPPPCDLAAATDSKIAAPQRTITEIRIYDARGNLKKVQKENKTLRATINLTGFKSGVYIVEITDGTYKEKQQLLIQQ